MSKLDQLKALGAARHATKGHISEKGGLHKPHRVGVLAKAPRQPEPRNGPAAPINLKRGRPKITAPRPWDSEGMSRRTWYRRQKTKP